MKLKLLTLFITLQLIAFSQATLPSFENFNSFNGTFSQAGWAFVENPAGTPTYSYMTSGVGGSTAGRLDETMDYIEVFVAGQMSSTTYVLRGNNGGGGWLGTFKVRESIDGSTWTDLATYVNGALATTLTTYTATPTSTSRYIRWEFTSKTAGNNVVIDDINILGSNTDPEINIKQNTTSILSGGTTASFGSSVDVSLPLTLVVENLGQTQLVVSNVSFSGANASDYSITSSANFIVSPLSNANIDVLFTPSAPNNRIADIIIDNDDGNESVYVIQLNGFGGPESSFSLDTTLCEGNSDSPINNTTGSPTPSYLWSVSPSTGVTISNVNAATPTITYAQAGTYSVTLVSTNQYGSDTLSKTVVVNPNPIFTITASTYFKCIGDPSGNDVQLTFSPVQSITPSNTIVDCPSLPCFTSYSGGGITVFPNTTTTYTVTKTLSTGCFDTAQVTITYYSPPINLDPLPSNICAGDSITLNATGSDTYNWDNGVTNGIAFPADSTRTYTITATESANCTNTQQITVTVNPVPILTINASDIIICLGASPITLTASGADTYNWSNGITNGVSFNPTTSNTYTVSGSTTAGCTDTAQINVIVNAIPNVQITTSDDTLCKGNVSTLTASGASTYTWSNSNTGNTINVSPNASTNYTVTGVDVNGCQKVTTQSITVVNPATFNTTFSITPSQIVNLPNPAQFNNTTVNPSNYTFYWDFGDGTVLQNNNPSVFHVYNYNGNFDVALMAVQNASGCSETEYKPGYVFVTGGTNCAATASITSANGVSACPGDSLLLQANSGGVSYQWKKDGIAINGATTQNYYATSSGNYSVLVSDGTCAVSSSAIAISFYTSPSTPTITATGSFNFCGGGSVTLSANSGYTSYTWSNSATTQSIVVSQSGVYTLSVSNAQGCVAQNSYSLNGSNIQPIEICIVGVDSVTNKNNVIWNKPINNAIDSFYVYREGIVANSFDKIGAQAYDDFSEFIDLNANPQVQAYRYRVSIIDTCGIESLQSSFHKTIHLTINAGMGGAWNLIWSHYEGFGFGTYNIYRGTASNSISLLTSIASTNNSYTDLTPPGGIVYYQIEIVNQSSCNPTLRTATANYSSSKSNIVTTQAVGLNQQNQLTETTIFPNPFTNTLNINLSNKTNDTYTLRIIDVLGKVLLTEQTKETEKQLNLGSLSTGIYYLNIETAKGDKVVKKIIKQ